jgi:threonyl-tRNA synthetase
MELSTRPEKSIGSDAIWKTAEAALEKVLNESGRKWQLNPGDGAFYGPKIDFHLIDSLGRSWQCGTVQLDFSMPERFGLEFVGSDDKPHTPVMVHRAVLGSIERFMGIYIEHYAGAFPIWSAPVQARLVNVSEGQIEYTKQIEEQLTAAGIKVESDLRNEKLGYKIREAQLSKVPYMVVVGDKEVQSGTISPRLRTGEQAAAMTPTQFVDLVKKDCGELWGL